MHASLHSCDYCKHQSRKKKKEVGILGHLNGVRVSWRKKHQIKPLKGRKSGVIGTGGSVGFGVVR